MIRILLLGLCLATLAGGCSSTRKTKVTNGPGVESPDPPKEYKYQDMSRGGSNFRR